MLYKLEENTLIECKTGQEWMDWIDAAGDARIVAQEDVGRLLVSTVFQGDDPTASTPPRLFETMVFDEDGVVLYDFTARHETWRLAEVGHRRMVLRVRNSTIRTA
jgi:hypothetical protein